MADDDRDNGTSDPLPYTQVDRAVKAKAALLAGRLKCSNQHAVGSLVEFWDLNGDPRELEKLVAKGIREVLLTGEQVEERFLLAFAHEAPAPGFLVALGLLEDRGADLFRVRGMSRYFAPISKRVVNRENARKGGIASAVTRKERYGSAQPVGSTGAQAIASEIASGVASESLERSLQRPGSVAEVADSGQRTADSGQRSSSSSAQRNFPGIPTPPPSARKQSPQQECWQDLVESKAYHCHHKSITPCADDQPPAYVNTAISRAAEAVGAGEHLNVLINLFERWVAWPSAAGKGFPLALFLTPAVIQKVQAEEDQAAAP